jgi:hypothetical protein
MVRARRRDPGIVLLYFAVNSRASLPSFAAILLYKGLPNNDVIKIHQIFSFSSENIRYAVCKVMQISNYINMEMYLCALYEVNMQAFRNN